MGLRFTVERLQQLLTGVEYSVDGPKQWVSSIHFKFSGLMENVFQLTPTSVQ